ncbi:MAG TPA: glycosyltransferase [Chloroflexota bacterium]
MSDGSGNPACAAAELSVVVMAYNEAENLGPVVRSLASCLATTGVETELLIVDDGSTDGTSAAADRLSSEIAGLRAVHHGTNRGLGEVYKTGLSLAGGRFVTFFPADGQYEPEATLQLRAAACTADLVLGYLPEGRRGAVANLLSMAEQRLYSAMFGGFPRFQGLFLVRRSFLQSIPLRLSGRGWGIVMELIIRASRRGASIEHVALSTRPRRSGRSKVMNAKTIASNIKQLLTLWMLLK